MVRKTLHQFKLLQTFSYLVSKITRGVLISSFVPLAGIALGIPSSLIELKICAIDVEINK